MPVMMKKINLLYPLVFLLLISTRVSAQSPSLQPSPTSPAVTNITSALEKAGQFNFFIRLLKTTLVGDQLNSQINSNSTQGLTIFAPNDNSFSSLPTGTLNSFTDAQKIQLIQFHVLPTLISLSQFQTTSNPLRTQAGDNVVGQFPLNVSTFWNRVNLTTGVVTARIDSTIFSNSKVAIYQVNKVLLPMAMFKSSALAPTLTKPEKNVPTAPADTSAASRSDSIDVSDGISQRACPIRTASYVLVAILSMLIDLSY